MTALAATSIISKNSTTARSLGGAAPLRRVSARALPGAHDSKPRIAARARWTCCNESGFAVPSGRTSRLLVIPRTARHTATLSTSRPSPPAIRGRSGDGARELEIGTTTTSSDSIPVKMSSTEITMAGRCLAGSPDRPAPSATSQRSPLRGSINAVTGGGIPIVVLFLDCGVRRIGQGGGPLGRERGLTFSLVGEFFE